MEKGFFIKSERTLENPNVLREFRERLYKSIMSYPRTVEEAIIIKTAQMVKGEEKIPYSVIWGEVVVGVLDKMRLLNQVNKAKEIICEYSYSEKEKKAYE